METEYRFKDKSRVRLQDHIDPSFYNGMAKTGNEGWITQHRRDRNGLPEVYIQWDRLHWADNKQPDGWTFEEHFELVEEPMSEPEDDRAKAFFEMCKNFFTTGENQPPVEPQNQDDPEGEMHQTALAETLEALGDDPEGFFTIVITREPHPEVPQGRLSVSLYGSTLTPEADTVIGMQLSSIAARYHQQTGMHHIQHLTRED